MFSQSGEMWSVLPESISHEGMGDSGLNVHNSTQLVCGGGGPKFTLLSFNFGQASIACPSCLQYLQNGWGLPFLLKG
jgi:hypothetical protein